MVVTLLRDTRPAHINQDGIVLGILTDDSCAYPGGNVFWRATTKMHLHHVVIKEITWMSFSYPCKACFGRIGASWSRPNTHFHLIIQLGSKRDNSIPFGRTNGLNFRDRFGIVT